MSLEMFTELVGPSSENTLVGVDRVILHVDKTTVHGPDIDLEQYFHVGEFGRVIAAAGVSMHILIGWQMACLLL